MRYIEVFTPNEFPIHTYVSRQEASFEIQLRIALLTPRMAVSVSGPSKSGKTVLIERIAGADNLIKVSGASVQNPEDIWTAALKWMGVDTTVTTTVSHGISGQVSGTVSGEAGIPLIAKSEVRGQLTGGLNRQQSRSVTAVTSRIDSIASEIANSDFVLFIDDFHYIAREVQVEAAKQIKAAVEAGIKICVASVPHRSDDVVRANPELRGCITSIDITYWSRKELGELANKGFNKLQVQIDPQRIERFAVESCGSPQLMQSLCLQSCVIMANGQDYLVPGNYSLSYDQVTTVLEAVSTQCDFSSLIEQMHRGPKLRGQERKEFEFYEGTRGDVYRSVLLALAFNPPRMNLPYEEIGRRIAGVCCEDQPVGSSYSQACKSPS